ncbi:hypothetical protein DM02DRAFT_594193 [Periconia macrospinosa]|uniref:Endoplasmic reticulum lectin n=1 Tax=Periconia macrospinosa TaxID=97972 RepID=A0A2V1DMW9_9PLEO|nr:hypothetical protein DM02DRAFT_594193 [Periconia macrospinosa]
MKNFWALPAFLRLALASQQAFNVLEDLLAFPQFDVVYPQSYITEDDATSLLAHSTPHKTKTPITSTKSQETQDLSKPSKPSSSSSPDDELEYTYERVVVKGQRYLCSIPVIPDEEPQNSTVSAEEAKAEQEKELVRATDRGAELLQGMQGNCIYYVSGWWSYSFCYMDEVKQFHQLQTGRDLPIYPPVEDTSVKSFILGRYSEQHKTEKKKGRKTLGNEQGSKEVDDEDATKKQETALDLPRLETKGSSKYMVQHLSGGTECDLTGKDRKIEVQYHCHPSAGDRIAMIKEVSTCAYLMKIYTPRLCNDVAFLPPQDNLANHISCQPVLRSSEVDAWTLENAKFKVRETERLIAEAENNNPLRQMKDGLEGSTKRRPVIGGTEVGAQALVGGEGRVVERSIVVGGGKATNKGTVIDSDGRQMSDEELEELGIKPETLERWKAETNERAEGAKWKIDIVETPGGRHFLSIIDPEDKDTDGKETKKSDNGKKKRAAKNTDKSDDKRRGMGKEEERDPQKKGRKQVEDEDESEEGSEETYKDEL